IVSIGVTWAEARTAPLVRQASSTLPRHGARWPELKVPPPAQPNNAARHPATDRQMTRYATLAPMAGYLAAKGLNKLSMGLNHWPKTSARDLAECPVR